MITTKTLHELFSYLKSIHYVWRPLTPDKLLDKRKKTDSFDPIYSVFGLGLEAKINLPSALCEKLIQENFIKKNIQTHFYKSNFSVSGEPDLYVIHSHWPPNQVNADSYIHYGEESTILSRIIQKNLDQFIDKAVLDIGCSTGALLYEIGAVCNQGVGVDISRVSIELAKINSEALGFNNLNFYDLSIEDYFKKTDPTLLKSFDRILFNPPMVIPEHDYSTPHRDGGDLGIELPLHFLKFSDHLLKNGGEIFCLSTNPIINGRSIFFDRLATFKELKLIEKKCINSHFNQSVSRKLNYAKKGISQIELWFLNLRKS